jgi:choloylglycine hydrolase
MDLAIDDEPRMVTYPRGLERDGKAGDNSLTWKSKHGSVVMTAFGVAADDGINEHGLAAHMINLPDTEHEVRDSRPGIGNLLWIQYFLDNCTTVKDALAALDTFQVASVEVQNEKWPQHVALEDATGDSAVLEYVNGKLVVYRGPQYTVLTNEPTLDDQLKNLKRYKFFGGNVPLPGDIDPMSRFVQAASYLKTLPEPRNEREALVFLRGVMFRITSPFGSQDTSGSGSSNVGPTRWLILYDLTGRTIYFMGIANLNLFQVSMKNVDFEEGAPVLQIDPMAPGLCGEMFRLL